MCRITGPILTERELASPTQMGVTIHFEGRLTGKTAYEELIGVVSSLAELEGWRTETIDSAEVTLLRVRDEQDWNYTGPVKGVALHLHEDCDPVRLEFDKDLYVQEFTKTQFAGAEYHLKVIDLLKAIQPFFCELNVSGEGEYWDTNDRSILQYHLDTIRNIIEAELKENPFARMRVKTPDGKIIDLMK
jgi:hypothetical protein